MNDRATSSEAERGRIEAFRERFTAIEREVGKVIVGHHAVLRKVLAAFFAGGHVLLEGVPGLGKTLIVRSVSTALGLSFKRIQFTPDLMPSDIIGAQILTEEKAEREFRFRPGPIFAHIVLADEVNRASPKTQSAVLEAMEERQVTAYGETYPLPQMVRFLEETDRDTREEAWRARADVKLKDAAALDDLYDRMLALG